MSNETPIQSENRPPNTPLRRIGRFALVALCFIIAYVIFQPLLILFSTQHQFQQYTSPADLYDERNPFVLHFLLSETESQGSFDLALNRIYADSYLPSTCIKQFNIFTDIDASIEYASQRLSHEFEEICAKDILNNTTRRLAEVALSREEFEGIDNSNKEIEYELFDKSHIEPITSSIQFNQDISSFYFPFEKRHAFFAVSIPIRISKDQTSTSIIPTVPGISLSIENQNWENHIISSSEIFGSGLSVLLRLEASSLIVEPGESTQAAPKRTQAAPQYERLEPTIMVSIVQQRPLSQRLLSAVLLTSILIFILSLLFIQETGTFLEVAVGILLGLWGVQDILIPDYITGPTFINTLILAFYVLLAFVAAIRFAVRPLWHRLGPPSPTPPPDPGPPTPPPPPEPPAPAPVVIQPQKGGVLQWITAVSATITAIATLLHLINRRKNH